MSLPCYALPKPKPKLLESVKMRIYCTTLSFYPDRPIDNSLTWERQPR